MSAQTVWGSRSPCAAATARREWAISSGAPMGAIDNAQVTPIRPNAAKAAHHVRRPVATTAEKLTDALRGPRADHPLAPGF